MGSNDPPAPALGAHNLALLRRIAAAPHLQDDLAQVVTRDLVALLAAYDAQAARLAAVEAERDQALADLAAEKAHRYQELWYEACRMSRDYRERGEAAERERDQWQDRYARLDAMHVAVCKRNARLEALEQAARMLDAVFQECVQHGRHRITLDLQHRIVTEFQAAVINLTTLSKESTQCH